MRPRHLLATAAVTAALTAVAIWLLDAPLARALATGDGAHSPVLRHGTRVLEVAFGMTLPRFLLGGALIVAGAAAWRWRAHAGRALVLGGATLLTTRLVAGLAKPLFERLRPNQAIAAGDAGDSFFHDGGIAFPSGHVAHFFALWFALAVAWPRARWLTLPTPLFIAAARIGTNDHFLSDALASIALAAAFAAAYARLLRVPAPAAQTS